MTNTNTTTDQIISQDEFLALSIIADVNQPLSTSEITERFILDSGMDIDISLPFPDEVNERFEAAVVTLIMKHLIKESSISNTREITYEIKN